MAIFRELEMEMSMSCTKPLTYIFFWTSLFISWILMSLNKDALQFDNVVKIWATLVNILLK